jgi:hypothetical protein|tara:strand:- start:4658 stop:4855 length:198 start_codon:yes stop_codon:yes gene_type:complete
MDYILLTQHIQKVIRERKSVVREVLENNGVNSMEQYRELMGELNGLNYVSQELTGLLEKQELLDE